MAPREDLVSSAVTFLQDPSVASSPIEKRIEFLRSKNLTQEEVDLAIARSTDDSYQPASIVQQQGGYASQPPAVYNRAAPPQRYPPYGGAPYGGYGDWAMPPPEVPKRDWRDWFIMATVTGGAAYGLYVLTKRYIAPLISPPTPPQLEADKSAIDEQFTRAFALIETLSNDTATLKAAEESRTERLDRALAEVESVVSELKAATGRREDEVRRINEELRGLKEGIPRALDGHKESSEKRLGELGSELRSLKALLGNRFSGSASQAQPSQSQAQQQQPQPPPSLRTLPPTSSSTTAETPSQTTTQQQPPNPTVADVTSPSATTPKPYSFPGSSSAGSSSGSGSGKAAIPAWQMAASRKAVGTPTAGGSSAGAGA